MNVESVNIEIPADIYRSSIKVDARHIRCRLHLSQLPKSEDVYGDTVPSHRKTQRRIARSPPYDPGGREEFVPDVKELTKSFLAEDFNAQRVGHTYEEAEHDAQYRDVAENDENAGVGVGTIPGLPGFLTGFLQGIVDRFQITISDLEISLELPNNIDGDNIGFWHNNKESRGQSKPMLVLSVNSIAVEEAEERIDGTNRRIAMNKIELNLNGLSSISPVSSTTKVDTFAEESLSTSTKDKHKTDSTTDKNIHLSSPESSTSPAKDQRLAPQENDNNDMGNDPFDIQIGEDNSIWNNRQSQKSSFASNSWIGEEREDDLIMSMHTDHLLTRPEVTRESPAPAIRVKMPGNFLLGSGETSPSMERKSRPDMLDEPTFSGSHVEHHTSSSPLDSTPATTQPGFSVDELKEDDHMEASSMYLSALSEDPQNHLISEILPPMRSAEDHIKLETQSTISTKNEATAFLSPNMDVTSQIPILEESLEKDGIFSKLLYIDDIVIDRKSYKNEIQDEGKAESHGDVSNKSRSMPGSFSIYAEQSASIRFDDMRAIEGESPKSQFQHQAAINITVHNLTLCVEFKRLAEYNQLVKHLTSNTSHKADERIDLSLDQQQKHAILITLQDMRIAVVSSQNDFWQSVPDLNPNSRCLIDIRTKSTSLRLNRVDTSKNDVTLSVCSLRLYIGSSMVLSFADHLNESRRSLQDSDVDLILEIHHRSSNVPGSLPLSTQYSLQTKQLILNISFETLEQTFGDGMCSLLELSSSFTTKTFDSGHKSPPKKGVRFQDSSPPQLNAEKDTEIKFNARIDSIVANLSGHNASIRLRSSAIKAVARKEFVAATIDSLKLSGPYLHKALSSTPLEISLSGIRLEYLFQPKDVDLERLVMLLTPSNNKYEDDDDILLDTLLRQRRKGAVVRFSCTEMIFVVLNWDFLENLQVLSEELVDISVVAKYLPEDERPGLLSLACIQHIQLILPLNNIIKNISVKLTETNLAHIGLPSLLAFSINDVVAGPDGAAPILHALSPLSSNANLPMLMARMIGDEVEPTLRIKLFNVAVEYNVATFIALTDEMVKKADEAVDIAASTIIDFTNTTTKMLIQSDSLNNVEKTKKLSIHVLLHDCGIGLQPTGLKSKAILVLQNAKLITIVPTRDNLDLNLDIRKGSLYIADIVENVTDIGNIKLVKSLPSALLDLGYVSVFSIMAARYDIRINQGNAHQSQTTELDFKCDLLLLESCADSTQTLIQILGALAPPSLPSDHEMFRTNVISMDEMISSFTGDAFERPASPPSTIFDINTTRDVDDLDDLFGVNMSESIYDDRKSGIDSHTAESLLGEDPFLLPTNPISARLNNKELSRALESQLSLKGLREIATIKPFLLSDNQLDRTYGDTTVLGSPYRWNTSITTRTSKVEKEHRIIPLKVRVRDVHVIWNLYDGYDWQRTRKTITNAVEEVETKTEAKRLRRKGPSSMVEDQESIIGDCLFNSIYIGIPANKDVSDLRREINHNIDDLASESESHTASAFSRPTTYSTGSAQRQHKRSHRLRLTRSKAHKISFELRGLSIDFVAFVPGSGEVQNTTNLRVRDLEIFDNLPTSTWKKFLTTWHKDGEEREMAKPMIHIDINTVRPIVDLSTSEIVMTVDVTPLRLHVDQDALDFITRFFEFKDDALSPSTSTVTDVPFLQRVEVHTVDLSLDYKPKRVDYAGLRSGRYVEFKNFFILDAAHIILRHTILYGIRGFDALHDSLNDIWLPDIKRNQLPGVISGLASISPFVSLGTGIAEVVSVPIREYKKDGRVVRSIQKGAAHLLRNTTGEVARLGARIAVGTQNVLQGAETFLSNHDTPQSPDTWTDIDHPLPNESENTLQSHAVSNYANQPLSVMAGLKSARRLLERDLLTARDAIIAVQGDVADSTSASDAVSAVIRHAPTIMLRPVIGASRAVGQTLMGVGNEVDKNWRKKVEDVSTIIESSARNMLIIDYRNINNDDELFDFVKIYEVMEDMKTWTRGHHNLHEH